MDAGPLGVLAAVLKVPQSIGLAVFSNWLLISSHKGLLSIEDRSGDIWGFVEKYIFGAECDALRELHLLEVWWSSGAAQLSKRV